jgi:hypothetical protein
MDMAGETLWARQLDERMGNGMDVRPASDGGFAIAAVTWQQGREDDFWLIKTDSLGGVRSGTAEQPVGRASPLKPDATIVRGVLFLPTSLPTANSSLLAADGREALNLKAGPNDVSRLAPGVYFVRGAAVHRLVIAR